MTAEEFNFFSSGLDDDWLYHQAKAAGNISRREFFSRVDGFRRQLTRLADFKFAIVLCQCPVNALTAFTAVAANGAAVLLPASSKPEQIKLLEEKYPEIILIHDGDIKFNSKLPVIELNSKLKSHTQAEVIIPTIPAGQLVAILFTSGSTGEPKENRKYWGDMVSVSRLLQARLELGQQDCLLVTVPPQHAYGFETIILMPCLGGVSLYIDKLFYPADIQAAIGEIAATGLSVNLVTTPVHLRALLDSGLKLAGLRQIISSSAPLSKQLARQVEKQFLAPLMEVFGSTEMTSIATRRTAHESEWQLYPGVELKADESGWLAVAAHLPQLPRLDDRIELNADNKRYFSFLGRNSDLIKVAGKRTSLQYLNECLLEIPGVIDGVFLVIDDRQDSRLQALAVAPTLSKAEILAALNRVIEPAFIPRPLHLVSGLPRNGAGKLPGAAIVELLKGQQ